MKIILCPVGGLDTDVVYTKIGNAISVNGEVFDFSRMGDGDLLPSDAVMSKMFVGMIEHKEGDLVITLVLPTPPNYSPEQAFPEPLLNVQDGVIPLPQPLPDPEPEDELEIEGELRDE